MNFRNRNIVNELGTNSLNDSGPLVFKLKARDVGIHCCCASCEKELWERMELVLFEEFGAKELIVDDFYFDKEPSYIIQCDYNMIIECHESGPEIIAAIGLIASGSTIIKDIYSIAVYFYKYMLALRQKEDVETMTTMKLEVLREESEEGSFIEIMSVEFDGTEESFNTLIKGIKGKL